MQVLCSASSARPLLLGLTLVFLNALMDASDDVPGVVFVVVMIRSELDPEGYTPAAENFRQYIARRLNRNGTTVAVTELSLEGFKSRVQQLGSSYAPQQQYQPNQRSYAPQQPYYGPNQ